ncbi:lanthionine synthetase C family protein [Plantactinospora sp. CA-290183]|uniref:lanthionine synthetase C family protein n=1 Tax=Plantactinospora sp. CA-290183 TaxID=3240006 RepID=UPI003D8C04B9
MVLTDSEAGRQSLANGTAGTALLHIERALTGTGGWATAHRRIRRAANGPLDAGDHAGLYYGAPAIAFVLHCAHPRYQPAAIGLDRHLLRLAQRRLATANTRIDRGQTATFGEYDLFYGLTGLAALLLRHQPDSDTLADLLRYLIRLTRPHRADGIELPGWWVAHHPDPSLPTPGGHANLGMAHGAAGLLALLSLATRHGRVVDGQTEAIDALCDWFDRWRQDSDDGSWWPQWLTRDDLRTGRPSQRGPGRPSWCYGAVGIARALQLAAIATHHHRRRATAEDTLAACLTGRQLRRITDTGLCHGIAGIYQTAYRAARDARTPTIGQQLPALAETLSRHAAATEDDPTNDAGLLTGSAGARLTLETASHTTPPRSGWDACLLIT